MLNSNIDKLGINASNSFVDGKRARFAERAHAGKEGGREGKGNAEEQWRGNGE